MRRSSKLYALTLSLACAAHLALLGLPLPDASQPQSQQETMTVALKTPPEPSSDTEKSTRSQPTARDIEPVQTISPGEWQVPDRSRRAPPSATAAKPEAAPESSRSEPSASIEPSAKIKPSAKTAQSTKAKPAPPPAEPTRPTAGKPEQSSTTPPEVEPEPIAQAQKKTPEPADTDQEGKTTASANPPSVAEKATKQATQRLRNGYRNKLLTHLDQYRRYPLLARRQQQQGIVTVRFVVDRKGQLVQSSLLRSTPFALLNREALALLERAAPFPPAPDALADKTLTWELPVKFRLR